MKIIEKTVFTNFQKALLLLLTAIFLLTHSFVFADQCEWCERQAILKKCENLHIQADYFEKMQRWMECMDKNMPYHTFDDKDPAFLKALAKCAQLAPDEPKGLMYPGGIEGNIAELYTCSCFHMRGRHPEYTFEATFEAGLGGKEKFKERGTYKKVESILIISLYYDGDERIHVKTWQTKSPLNSIYSHYRRMFLNSDAKMRLDKPLQNLLWEFEQTPIKCQILPEEISVKEKETKEISLAGFFGSTGPSKSFNRIVVKVDEGEILNGEQLFSDPKARVFKVGQGMITVVYKAPEPCLEEEDTIHVYNSCDIAKEALIPLSETKIRDEIDTKTIEIECDWEWTGKITFRRETNVNISGPTPDGGHGTCKRKIQYNLTIDCKLKTTYSDRDEIVFDGRIIAPYSLSADFLVEVVDKDGIHSKLSFVSSGCSGTIKDSYDPEEEQTSGVSLYLNKPSMTYELQIFLALPCTGTCIMAIGDNVAKESFFDWDVNALISFEDQTDGKTVSGFWKAPPCTQSTLEECGLWPTLPYDDPKGCGTTWTWNLKRIK